MTLMASVKQGMSVLGLIVVDTVKSVEYEKVAFNIMTTLKTVG